MAKLICISLLLCSLAGKTDAFVPRSRVSTSIDRFQAQNVPKKQETNTFHLNTRRQPHLPALSANKDENEPNVDSDKKCWVDRVKKSVASAALVSFMLFGNVAENNILESSPLRNIVPTTVAYATDSVKVASCLFKSCSLELGQCILNPNCLANVICLNTCNNKPDETECQIKCGNLFENDVVGKFNTCAVSQKKCVPQVVDTTTYPFPPMESISKDFKVNEFDGKWYISAGLNRIFDCFDCQVHFFTSTGPGKMYGKLNWRIEEPDGEFFTRDAIQSFVQDPKTKGILYNHDNDFLHYEDDWYILDHEPDQFILVYYRGRNDAWIGYGGAVLYSRSPTVPMEFVPRIREACAKTNIIKWDDFLANDNTCSPQRKDSGALRAQYAKKVLITEEEDLVRELTLARNFVAATVEEEERDVGRALSTLNSLVDNYEVQLVDTVEEEVREIERALDLLKSEFGKLGKEQKPKGQQMKTKAAAAPKQQQQAKQEPVAAVTPTVAPAVVAD